MPWKASAIEEHGKQFRVVGKTKRERRDVLTWAVETESATVDEASATSEVLMPLETLHVLADQLYTVLMTLVEGESWTSSSLPSPSGYSKEDYGRSWSSQEWKSGVAAHDRSGKPEKISWDAMQQVRPHHGEPLLDGNAQSVRYGEIIHDGSVKRESVNYQEEAESETFVMGSDAAEFVNKVKDQVRKRPKRILNVADSGEEHSIIWGMFMVATMNAATFMGKNFSGIQNSIMNMNSTDLTPKHMFDITAKLVGKQDDINNLDNIQWGKNSWRQLSLIGDETVINLQRTKVYVFSEHPESNEAWKNRVAGARAEKSYRDFDGIDGEPTEFEWNIFPGFTTLQLCGKVNDLLSDLGEAPETFTGRILLCQCFNDISCDRKGNKE